MRAMLDKKASEGGNLAGAKKGVKGRRAAGARYVEGRETTSEDQLLGRDGLPHAYGDSVGSIAPPGESRSNHQQGDGELALDVVDRGLVSMTTARQLVELYKTDLFPHFYMVVLHPSQTADELRRFKPILFLAVLAAASGTIDPQLSKILDQEILQTYATEVHVRSEKSLEIVQALLVSSVWYSPPNKFGQLKYYEYIHMALSMAFDIGIGSRMVNSRRRTPHAQYSTERTRGTGGASDSQMAMSSRDLNGWPVDDDAASELERRRAFIAVYSICAGVSFSTRRPAMLRINSYVRECIDYVDNAPHALPSDRTMMHWVKMIVLSEEIATAFFYDDVAVVASFADHSTRMMIKEFDRRLTEMWAQVPPGDCSLCLQLNYHTTRLCLYEVALHIDHSPDDFKAPYQMGSVQPREGSAQIPTQPLAEALAEIIDSCHKLLDAFLAPDSSSLRGLPVFCYVRVSLAAFVLAKLTLSSLVPESRIGQLLDRSSLKVDYYLQRVVAHISDIVGKIERRVPAIFLALLFKLHKWCACPELIEQAPAANSYQARLEDTQVPWRSSYGDKGDDVKAEGVKIAGTTSSNTSPGIAAGPSTGESKMISAGSNGLSTSSRHDEMNGTPAQCNFSAIYIPQVEIDEGSGVPFDGSWFPLGDQMELESNFFEQLANENAFTGDASSGVNGWDTLESSFHSGATGTADTHSGMSMKSGGEGA